MRSLAKITRPRASGVVARRRLYRQLDSVRRQPLVWVCGPAGAGKTTLVSSYLDARRLSSLWYQVDSGDADPATFFCYMSIAARGLSRGKRRPLPLLTPEYQGDVPTFALRYFERLFERFDARTLLVLDNYQEVSRDSPFHKVLLQGLAAMPAGLRVVVVSRHLPPPQFARLRANRQLAIVGWEDLRLTLAETRALVRGRLRPTKEVIAQAHRIADGWAAGVVMMLERAKASSDAARLPHGLRRQNILDYFGSEVFERADPETQEFLLKTAFLPKMTARTAEDLSGCRRASEILEGLARSHFFTARDVQAEPTYQYHPLFHEFLIERARRLFAPGAVRTLIARAASLLVDVGQIEGAVALLQEIGTWDALADLVAAHAAAMAAQGRLCTLETWIRAIPEETRDANAWLLHWLGVCRMASDPSESRLHLERAFERFGARADMAGQLLSWSAIVDTYLYAWDEFVPLDRWIAWLDDHVPASFKYPSHEIEAAVTISMAGALVHRQPHHASTDVWVSRAEDLLRTSSEAPVRLRAGTWVALRGYWNGEYERLARAAEELRRASRSPDASPLSLITWWFFEAATVCGTLEGSPEDSLRAVEAGLAAARATGVHALDPMLLGQGTLSSITAGDLSAAKAYLGRMATSARGCSAGAYRDYLTSLVALHGGDLSIALAHAQEAVRGATESGLTFSTTLARLALADVLHSLGRCREAHGQLAECRRIVDASGSVHFARMCDLSEARMLLDEDGAEAHEAVARVVTAAAREGFPGIYTWAPVHLTRLCVKALDAGLEIEFVQRLVRARRLVPPASRGNCVHWPWATRIRSLGGFEITREGKALAFSAKAPQRILTLLKAIITFGNTGATTEALADLLWPDAEGDAAQQALATSLHRLRQLLGDERAVSLRDGRVRLDCRHCWVDALAFESSLDRAGEAARAEGAVGEQRALEQAVALYRGAFLGEEDEPWAVAHRERLRGKFVRTVERLGERDERQGRYEQAAKWYLRALDVDDLAETLYRRAMGCYARLGQTSEAMGIYKRCCRVLRGSTGVSPSAETEALVASLRRHSTPASSLTLH